MKEDVTFADLTGLLVGVSLAAEHDPDPPAQADRLFRLVVTGLCPQDRLRPKERDTSGGLDGR